MPSNKMPREFFLPKNATKIADKQSDAVAYVYNNSAGQPCAKVFYGKQSKPVAAYRYRNLAEREKSVTGYFASRRTRCASKAEEQAKRKAFKNPYKVGDVFKTCWGYDQTNVEWFGVVEVKGQMLIVQQMKTESVDTGYMTGKSVPMAGQFFGEQYRVKAQDGGFKSPIYGWASYQAPVVVAGIPTYKPASWTAYA